VGILQVILAWLLGLVLAALLFPQLRKFFDRRASTTALENASDAIDDWFEPAPIGYLEIDRQGLVQRVNRRECELRGLNRREIVGRHCSDLLPPPDRQRYRQQTEQRMSGQVALVSYQTKYLRPDGSTVTVEVHEQLLRNRAGYVGACAWPPST